MYMKISLFVYISSRDELLLLESRQECYELSNSYSIKILKPIVTLAYIFKFIKSINFIKLKKLYVTNSRI